MTITTKTTTRLIQRGYVQRTSEGGTVIKRVSSDGRFQVSTLLEYGCVKTVIFPEVAGYDQYDEAAYGLYGVDETQALDAINVDVWTRLESGDIVMGAAYTFKSRDMSYLFEACNA